MTTRNLGPLAHPLFLSKNWFNQAALDAADLVATPSGQAIVNRLFDFDRLAIWSSSNSNDGIDEVITAGLYQDSLKTLQTIDFVGLFGINLKNFIFEFSNDDGASYSTFPGLDFKVFTGDFSGTDKIVNLAAGVDMNKWRLTMTRTQVPQSEKTVGFIVVAQTKFQPSRGMSIYRPEVDDRNVIEQELADGSKARTHQLRSDASFEFYRALVGFVAMTEADRDNFRTIKRDEKPFIWYPEPGEKVGEIFLSQFAAGSFREPYMSLFKAAGRNIGFEIEEVGGG